MRNHALFSIILAFAAWPVSADMFKWTDADGNIQYGQFPPVGVEAERIRQDGIPTGTPGKSPQERLKAMEAEQRQQGEAEKMQAEDAERAALRKQNCATARETRELLSRGGNRRYRLPDGTVTRLTEEEVAQRIEEAEGQIKEYCD
jgi:hypothetical protein